MADAGESETFGTLLARVREMVSDQGHGRANALRWKDEELLRYLFDGITTAEKIRPAVRYAGMRLAERAFPAVEPDDYASANARAAAVAPKTADDAERELRESVLVQAKAAPCRLDRHFHEAVEHYAASRALAMDENDATPAYRSNMHRKRFEELVRS